MTSVVIAAYNESTVIGRTLDTLLAGATDGELDVTVVANGCTDDTPHVAARRRGVRVVELAHGNKPRALDAGDAVARGFPRVYLDADIPVTVDVIRTLCAALTAPPNPGAEPPLAAVPRRVVDARGRPLLVRAYEAIHGRHPAFHDGLFGRGVIVLSEVGRSRFEHFPDMVADDLYLDSLFSPGEKVIVDKVSAVVQAPFTTRDLLQRLERVRRGNRQLRASAGRQWNRPEVRSEDRSAWLLRAVLRAPWLAPAAAAYGTLTVIAEVRARRAGPAVWGRDESTRAPAT